MNAVTTNTTRTSVASTARYSAIPPHTPPITRLVLLRSRRDFTNRLPSLRVLVGDRDRQCGDGRYRNGGLLGQGQKSARRDREARERFDRGHDEIGRKHRRDRGKCHRGKSHEPGGCDTREER